MIYQKINKTRRVEGMIMFILFSKNALWYGHMDADIEHVNFVCKEMVAFPLLNLNSFEYMKHGHIHQTRHEYRHR